MKKIILMGLTITLIVFLSGCIQVLEINTKELPVWEAPGSATFKLNVTGGVPPYSFSLASGSQFPEGFVLGPDGTIGGLARLPHGTPNSISPPFTIIAKDSMGTEAKATYTIRLVAKNTLQIIPTPVICVVDQNCNEQIATASDGYPPYSFLSDSFREGAPPMGTIIEINGHLIGTPSTVGEYTVGVCAKDTLGYQRCGKAVVTVRETVSLEGTWVGEYQETETSECCKLRNSGILTLKIEVDEDGKFHGSLNDEGTSEVLKDSDPECVGGSYQKHGEIKGSVKGDGLVGTLLPENYKLSFIAVFADSTMIGKYSGEKAGEGESIKVLGIFKLYKK